jgi:hypothetical protein
LIFQSDEQSIDRGVKLLEDMWSDNTVSPNDSASIACKRLLIYSIDCIGFFPSSKYFESINIYRG